MLNRKRVTADTASDVMLIQQFFQFQEVTFRELVTADTASDVMLIQQFFQFQEVAFRELKEHQPPPQIDSVLKVESPPPPPPPPGSVISYTPHTERKIFTLNVSKKV